MIICYKNEQFHEFYFLFFFNDKLLERVTKKKELRRLFHDGVCVILILISPTSQMPRHSFIHSAKTSGIH